MPQEKPPPSAGRVWGYQWIVDLLVLGGHIPDTWMNHIKHGKCWGVEVDTLSLVVEQGQTQHIVYL